MIEVKIQKAANGYIVWRNGGDTTWGERDVPLLFLNTKTMLNFITNHLNGDPK